MVTFCSLLVALSLAATLRMPLASMSKVTSICGTPRGAGGMPSSRKVASFLLSDAISRSPCSTTMSTDGWMSDAVEKIWVCDGRDGRVAVDHLGRHAAQGLDPQRQRRHVEQQDVLDLAAQHAGLDGGADRDHLVGVDALVRLLAGEHRLDRLDDGRHAGHATDQDHLVDVGRLERRVGERLLDRPGGLADQVGDQVLQLGAGQGDDQVLRPGGIGADEGQVDLGGGRARQLDLRLLGGLLQALERDPVLRQVDPLVLLELLATASR